VASKSRKRDDGFIAEAVSPRRGEGAKQQRMHQKSMKKGGSHWYGGGKGKKKAGARMPPES